MSQDPDRALEEVRAWVDHAVIGLGLCPFAKAVQVKGLVRYVVTAAADTATLRDVLATELERLRDAPIGEIETTVLVHPCVLNDFADYNDFLADAEMVRRDVDPDAELQIASFHPDYRFAGTAADDITNATNRSPWPVLHLLREESLDRAVAAFPEAERIYEANMATMERLGPAGWAALREKIRASADTALARRDAPD